MGARQGRHGQDARATEDVWFAEEGMAGIVHRRKRRPFSVPCLILWGSVGVLAVIGGIGGGLVATVYQSIPDGTHLQQYRPNLTTKIYSRDGQELARLFAEHREMVPLEQIPQALINATVAIEDSRFFEHGGVDLRGIGRALKENWQAGRPAQGGSTITQQLARELYLSRKPTLMRKLQEALLALKLERYYSKWEILEMYLNQVCYGERAYGVAAAAEVYFGKKLQDLNLSECALLAGLPRWPERYSPFKNYADSDRRRRVVLRRMRELGYITPQEEEQAWQTPIVLNPHHALQGSVLSYKWPYFTTYAVDQLLERYGEDRVYRGGLRVYTTLHPPLQQAAEEALRRGLERARARRVSQGAVVCIDVQTGQILALVGGRGFSLEDQFNRATQALRQPGSSFKPFLYAAAIDHGFSPYDRLSGTPTSFDVGESKPYRPQNYSPKQNGPYTLMRALEESVNVVAVRLIDRLGPTTLVDYAHRLGIRQPLRPVYSLALGSIGVTPLEMATAYIPFANLGYAVEPTVLLRVEDSQGNLLYQASPQRRRVLSEHTAYTLNRMLRNVVLNGTGRSAQLPIPVCGKTGTTNSDRDAWFIGFTTGMVTAVWVGNDDNGRMWSSWGGNTCAPIWVAVNRAAMKMFNWPADFAKPSRPLRWEEGQSYDEDRPRKRGRRREKKEASPPTAGEVAGEAESTDSPVATEGIEESPETATPPAGEAAPPSPSPTPAEKEAERLSPSPPPKAPDGGTPALSPPPSALP